MLEETREVPSDYVSKNSFVIEGNGDDDMGYYYERGKEKWICYQSVCDFYIHPEEYLIEGYYREEEHLELALLYLLSDCLSAYLRSVGQYMFHAASVMYDGKSMVFSTFKGGGKSTLLSSLCNCGGKVITDDLTSVLLTDQGIHIQSSFPNVKLNSGQYELANEFIKEAKPVLKGSLKKNCTLKQEFFADGVHKLDRFYIINPVTYDQPIRVRKLDLAEGFVFLIQCIFSGTTASDEEIIFYQKVIKRMLSEGLVFQVDIPRDLSLIPDVIDVVTHYI